jgi:hypothetical protein
MVTFPQGGNQLHKNMKTHSIPLVLAALAVTSLGAQEEQPPRDHRPPPVLFGALDADHDGKISVAEIQTASDAIAKLDQNGDGEITKDEIKPPDPAGDAAPPKGQRPPGPPPHFGPPPVVAALDGNKNGTISADELEKAPESLKQLDKNTDGELSPEEIRPMGPPPVAPIPGGE